MKKFVAEIEAVQDGRTCRIYIELVDAPFLTSVPRAVIERDCARLVMAAREACLPEKEKGRPQCAERPSGLKITR
jgi:hypothetical protein